MRCLCLPMPLQLKHAMCHGGGRPGCSFRTWQWCYGNGEQGTSSPAQTIFSTKFLEDYSSDEVTRNTSSSDVTPSRAFIIPTMRNVRMPSDNAVRLISVGLASLTIR